jgi:hypothetical protein
MTRLLEGFRKDAETASEAAEFEGAMAIWDTGRALAALAYGLDDPRVRAMIARAARSALMAGFTKPSGDHIPLSFACAAGASSKWVLKGAALPEGERLFCETTWELAKKLGTAALGFFGRAMRTVEVFPASRGIPEALWPIPSFWNGHDPELPGDPAARPRPGEDEYSRKLAASEEKGGKGSYRWLETSSKLGAAKAARAFALPRPAGGSGEESRALAGEAETLLRAAADGLAASRGESNKGAQDARARLALFLMRDSGPLRVLARPDGDAPPPEALEEALGIWTGIAGSAPPAPEGENRRTDSELRAAECCVMLGREDEARRLVRAVVARRRDVPKSSLDSRRPSVRDSLALYAMAEEKARGGDIEDAACRHAEVLNRFRETLGNEHRLAVRSLCRLAELDELDELDVQPGLAAALRAQAAEALEDMAQPRKRKDRGPSEVLKIPEDPDCHFLRCLAARAFLEVGDREEALAVLGPAAEALERFAGVGDPRTERARELLAEARRLPEKGPSGPVAAPAAPAGSGRAAPGRGPRRR